MIRIGIIGLFQNGKSTLVNCLLDGKYAQTGGSGLSVTSICSIYQHQNYSYAWGKGNSVVKLNSDFLTHLCLLDTPGFEANKADTTVANNSLDLMDVAIFLLVNIGISQQELSILQQLKERSIPFAIVMNCFDSQGDDTADPNSVFNKEKAKEILNKLNGLGLHPVSINGNGVFCFNLLWYWYSSGLYLKDSPEVQKRISRKISSLDFDKSYLAENNNVDKFKAYWSDFFNLSGFMIDTAFSKLLLTHIDRMEEKKSSII